MPLPASASASASASAALALLGACVLGLAGAAHSEDERTRAPAARIVDPRAPELAEDPSAFATTIELEDYAGEAKSTEDLLSRAVGVQVRRFGGPGQLAEISIRGSSGSQVVILLDGVRINSALSGGVDLSTLPPGLIDRIEIERGGGSAQAGSGAIGGVVNIVTRRPEQEPRTSATVSAGSFGTWEGSLSHTRRTGPLGVVFGYDGFASDGDWRYRTAEFVATGVAPSRELPRINNRSEHHSGVLKLDREIGSGLALRAGNRFFYQSRGQPGFGDDAGPFGGQSFTAHERVVRNVADVELRGDLSFGEVADEEDEPGVGFRLRGYHRYERTRFRDPRPSSGGAPLDSDNRQTDIGGRFGFDGALATWGCEHLWTVGGELRRESLVSNTFRFVERWVSGLQLQDEIAIAEGKLRLAPALRYDRSEGFDDRWLPRLGIVLEPVPILRIKANLERSFRVPTFDELFHPDEGFLRGNPTLSAERATNYDAGFELGVSRRAGRPGVRLEASWFRNDIENTIVFTRINTTTIAPQNINDAVVDGLELAAELMPAPWARLSGNYTRLWTEVERTGGRLPGRADSETSLRLELGPESKRWKLTGEWHRVGRIPISVSGRAFVAARDTWDASASVDLAAWPSWWQWLDVSTRWPASAALAPDQLRLALIGTNLSDRAVRDARGVPQPGRSFTLSLEGSW